MTTVVTLTKKNKAVKTVSESIRKELVFVGKKMTMVYAIKRVRGNQTPLGVLIVPRGRVPLYLPRRKNSVVRARIPRDVPKEIVKRLLGPCAPELTY